MIVLEVFFSLVGISTWWRYVCTPIIYKGYAGFMQEGLVGKQHCDRLAAANVMTVTNADRR